VYRQGHGRALDIDNRKGPRILGPIPFVGIRCAGLRFRRQLGRMEWVLESDFPIGGDEEDRATQGNVAVPGQETARPASLGNLVHVNTVDVIRKAHLGLPVCA
jgi:hypothetical protein